MKYATAQIRWFLGIVILTFVAACAATAPDYKTILTSADRPDADRKLDEVRKPHEVMAFYGVKKGDKVGDLFAARGYYTAVLSHVVGPEGVVYAANQTARPELHERVKQPSMKNVQVIDGPFDKLALPQDGSLDFVLIHLDYHDLAPDVRVAMNRRVFGALKRGGTYGVVDHSAVEGSGDRDAKTLHRIDKQFVIKEVTSVGFRMDKEGTMLSRPDDTRDFSVTKVRDRSDRFVLKFEKP
jgi:predicted methyltransferase